MGDRAGRQVLPGIPAINLYQQLHFVTTGKAVEQGRNVLQMQYDNKKEETMEK